MHGVHEVAGSSPVGPTSLHSASFGLQAGAIIKLCVAGAIGIVQSKPDHGTRTTSADTLLVVE